MNECMELEIQHRLPDVLHGTIPSRERTRVETHLAACPSCREELEALRAVMGAAVFTPAIDVEGIVRQIPPYRIITPAVARPARSPVMRWLVAAAVAVVVVGGGSVVMRDEAASEQPVVTATVRAPTLAMASGIDELSDGGLAQLLSEMNTFDALPADDPEPVFPVDASASADEDSV
ncbi:MAG: zf-HC2 domain-containing protein [Gemmatimonadota bacterium]|nr:zf-HC2 domain-containing protein [Gemmatimonadota bacterium]